MIIGKSFNIIIPKIDLPAGNPDFSSLLCQEERFLVRQQHVYDARHIPKI